MTSEAIEKIVDEVYEAWNCKEIETLPAMRELASRVLEEAAQLCDTNQAGMNQKCSRGCHESDALKIRSLKPESGLSGGAQEEKA